MCLWCNSDERTTRNAHVFRSTRATPRRFRVSQVRQRFAQKDTRLDRVLIAECVDERRRRREGKDHGGGNAVMPPLDTLGTSYASFVG